MTKPPGTRRIDLRDRELAAAWIHAGLCLARAAAGNEAVRLGGRVAHALLSESGSLPPPGVLADLASILSGRELPHGRPALPAGELGRALLAYEDRFLGRLVAEPLLDPLVDEIRRLVKGRLERAVALVAHRLLDEIGFRAGIVVPAGVLRREVARPEREILESGFRALRESPPVRDRLFQGYEELLRAERSARALLSEADVLVVRNLDALESLASRVGLAEIARAAEEIARSIPRRLKPRRRNQGPIPTALHVEDRYPAGGIHSIRTSGSPENLVPSELVYMETDAGGDLDLFDVRWVLGELLYYQRDESVLVRPRRAIRFVFLPDLGRARFKDPGLPWQRLVVALGVVVTAVRKLADWLSEADLDIRLSFAVALRGEMDLCRILLADAIETGVVRIEEFPDAEAENSEQFPGDSVVLGAQGGEASEEPWSRLDLSGPLPRLVCEGRVRTQAGDWAPGEAWAALARELLEELL